MKARFLIACSLFILLSVVITAIGLWHLSHSVHFERKEGVIAPSPSSPSSSSLPKNP